MPQVFTGRIRASRNLGNELREVTLLVRKNVEIQIMESTSLPRRVPGTECKYYRQYRTSTPFILD